MLIFKAVWVIFEIYKDIKDINREYVSILKKNYCS